MNDEWSRRATRRTFVGAVGGGAVALAGCSGTGGSDSDSTTSESETELDATVEATRKATDAPRIGYTYQRASGNRVTAGQGGLPDADPIDVSVNWTPAWVVGVPAAEENSSGGEWAIVGESGEVVGVRIAAGEASMTDVTPDSLPAGTPPVLQRGRPPTLLTPPDSATDPARATHPVPVSSGNDGHDSLLSLSADGDLVLWGTGEGDDAADGDDTTRGEADRLALDALPDARIVTAGGRAFVFADATTRYDHAVLGDGVEAGSVAVVDYRGGLSEETRIRPDPEGKAVFEGLAPIVADLTGDGTREVVVTETDADRGARVVVYSNGGERLATGPAIGHGYGWRHQLAVAPFGPGGGVEIGAVHTPHVGQTAEFYRLEGGELRIVGEEKGYSSHAMGSRNLDGGLAGDFDGDGRVELLVPTADRQALGGVRRTEGKSEGKGGSASRARGVWQVALGGDLTTNLGAVNVGGRVTVAAGWDGVVRFWPG